MHEVPSLPNHIAMGIRESTRSPGPTRAQSEGRDGLEAEGNREVREEPERILQGAGQEADQRQHDPGPTVPTQRENTEGRSSGRSRPGGVFGRLLDSNNKDGGSGCLFRRRGEVQHDLDQGGDGRDHEPPEGPGPRQEVKHEPGEIERSHPDFPSSGSIEHDDGPKVPLSPSEIRDRVAQGQARRAYMKKGMVRRFLGNAKTVAMSVLIATAAAIGASAQCVPQFAQVRPDVLEIFAGRAQVTQSFARWGWHAARPIDIKWEMISMKLINVPGC